MVEPKGSLDAFFRKAYPVIIGRREGAICVGRILGDHVWPDLGDRRGNIERMLKVLASKGGKIGVCGTCMDARGMKPEALVEGAHRSSMDELTFWTQEADKVIVF